MPEVKEKPAQALTVTKEPILPGPAPQAAPVATNPVHAQTKSDADAEIEAMLEAEKKESKAKAEGKKTDEWQPPESDSSVSSDIIANVKKETDEELFADDVEARQHRAVEKAQRIAKGEQEVLDKETDKSNEKIEAAEKPVSVVQDPETPLVVPKIATVVKVPEPKPIELLKPISIAQEQPVTKLAEPVHETKSDEQQKLAILKTLEVIKKHQEEKA